MLRTCPDCNATYDDVDHRTICPHPEFAMHTLVIRPGEPPIVATTLEELDAATRHPGNRRPAGMTTTGTKTRREW